MANIITRTKASCQFGQMLGEGIADVPCQVADEIREFSACSKERRDELEDLGTRTVSAIIALAGIVLFMRKRYTAEKN